jgi:hypothetical protein
MVTTYLDRHTGKSLKRYGRVGADRNSCSVRNQMMFVNPVTSHIVTCVATTSELKIMAL